jgi:hypothetical protein
MPLIVILFMPAEQTQQPLLSKAESAYAEELRRWSSQCSRWQDSLVRLQALAKKLKEDDEKALQKHETSTTLSTTYSRGVSSSSSSDSTQQQQQHVIVLPDYADVRQMQKDDGVELKNAMNKLQQLSKTVKDIASK